MFKRSISGPLSLLLVVLGLALLFLLTSCAPTQEMLDNGYDTSSWTGAKNMEDNSEAAVEDTVEDTSVTRYEIIFNGRTITGKLDDINSFGENVIIYDTNGEVYRTAWENILLIEN